MERDGDSEGRLERDIQYEILRVWGAHTGIRLFRTHTGAARVDERVIRFNTPGWPDIIGIARPTGRFVAIEVKSATGRQSVAQSGVQRVLEAFGGVYILARSVQDVDAALARLGLYR